VSPVYAAESIEEDALLVAARVPGVLRPFLLHRIRLRSGAIDKEFFQELGDSLVVRLSALLGFVVLAQQADTVAAISALTDSLYLFSTAGATVDVFAIPLKEFRRPLTWVPNAGPTSRAVRSWLSSFDRIMGLAWTASGDFVVQASYLTNTGPVFRTVFMSRNGGLKGSLSRSPKLLTSFGDTLVFLHPKALAPHSLCLTTANAVFHP